MDAIVEESRVEYRRLMSEELNNGCVKTIDDLQETHKNLKKQVVAQKQKECDSITDDEFDQMYNMQLLNDEIEKCFKVVQGEFEPKKSVIKLVQTLQANNKNDKRSCQNEIAIGIDLGTTNCCVAAYHNGKIIVIPNQKQDCSVTTPSYVAINPHDGTFSVGKPAKDNSFRVPESTIYDTKRIIGRKMNDPVLQNDVRYWPFTVTEHEGVPKIEIHGKYYYPEEISAKLLMEMRSVAENYFNLEPGSIKKAVITVPAYFTDGQRQATIDAGTLAGLKVLTILNEPTAAAIAYSFQRLDKKSKNALIFDIGGGTFDVAVLEMKPGEITVLAVDGDSHLGGEDFDKNMMKFCAKAFLNENHIDILQNKNSSSKHERDEARRNIRRLQMHCERTKKYLSGARETEILVEGLVNEKDLCVKMTREEFEKINDELFKRTINIVERALESSNLKAEKIDDVVLIGGSSRILKFQNLLKEYFKGKKLNVSINPDEAVAFGAAVQAAIMIGKAEDHFKLKTIQDVTPMPIGVELFSKQHSVIIPKNTKIPTKHTKEYVTVFDNQTKVALKIYEGENTIAAENTLLGQFLLDGLPPANAGEEVVEVTMLINSMGILHVEAESKSNKKKASITVKENKERISKQKIEELLKEAGLPPPEDFEI